MWEDWDDESVVYHVPAGKTHFLNAAGAHLLRFLGAREASLEEIAAALQAPRDSELRQQLALSLIRFEQLGLVERISAGQGSD